MKRVFVFFIILFYISSTISISETMDSSACIDELWDQFFCLELDDILYDDGDYLSRTKTEYQYLCTIIGKDPNNWLALRLAISTLTMLSHIDEKNLSIYEAANAEYTKLAESAWDSMSLDYINTCGKNDIHKGYMCYYYAWELRWKSYAENYIFLFDENIVNAFSASEEYLRDTYFRILPMIEMMSCYFCAIDNYGYFQIFQSFDCENRYGKEAPINICKDFSIMASVMLQENLCDSITDALYIRNIEANAFLFYSSYFNNCLDEAYTYMQNVSHLFKKYANMINASGYNYNSLFLAKTYDCHVHMLYYTAINDNVCADKAMRDYIEFVPERGLNVMSSRYSYNCIWELIDNANQTLNEHSFQKP